MGKSSWTWHHVTVFCLTFISFALFHACRKSWSNVKNTFEKELTPFNSTRPVSPYSTWESRDLFSSVAEANIFTGLLDTLYLCSYAIGLYLSGLMGDRLNLRYFLSGGMFLSATAMLLFGYVSAVTATRNRYYYIILRVFCGLLQSTGWPVNVTIMGNWFEKHGRGIVFGVWGSTSAVGNILAASLVSSVLNFGYEYGLLLSSYLLFCGGIVILCCLYPSPSDLGLSKIKSNEEKDPLLVDNDRGGPPVEQCPKGEVDKSDEDPISFCAALFIPGVIPYSLSYACINFVNYAFFFWLPLYLNQGLGWTDKRSDQLSTFFDIGSIFGAFIIGGASDALGRRSPLVVFFLLCSIGSLYWYSNVGRSYTLNSFVMALVGIFIGGPSVLMCSTIAADLGKQKSLARHKRALGTVTGIIDGTGCLGAAIGQIVVPYVNKVADWHVVFDIFIGMVIVSIAFISPIFYNDAINWAKSRKISVA